MNAYELADFIDTNDCEYIQYDKVSSMLRQQADRISVLEANHEIQKNINEKALQYIDQLEQGLRSSIDLNNAQATRTTTQTKPLSNSEIRTIQDMCHLKNVGYNNFIMRFARMIEMRHGIK